jgi:hypothetical protein
LSTVCPQKGPFFPRKTTFGEKNGGFSRPNTLNHVVGDRQPVN